MTESFTFAFTVPPSSLPECPKFFEVERRVSILASVFDKEDWIYETEDDCRARWWPGEDPSIC